VIPPFLGLGGPLSADASKGDTGVFINGREIHRQELNYLQRLFGTVNRGRYWLDDRGLVGHEGEPAEFNLRSPEATAGAGTGNYRGYTQRTPFGGTAGDGN